MTSRISLLQPKKFWVHWRYTLRLFDGQLKIVWCNSAIPRILSHFPSFSQILLLNSLFLSDGYLIFGYIWCFISRTLPVQSSSSFSPLFLIIFSSFFIIFHHFPSFSPLFSIIFHHFSHMFGGFWSTPHIFCHQPGWLRLAKVSLFALSCAAYRFSWMAPALAMTCLGFLEGYRST